MTVHDVPVAMAPAFLVLGPASWGLILGLAYTCTHCRRVGRCDGLREKLSKSRGEAAILGPF